MLTDDELTPSCEETCASCFRAPTQWFLNWFRGPVTNITNNYEEIPDYDEPDHQTDDLYDEPQAQTKQVTSFNSKTNPAKYIARQ